MISIKKTFITLCVALAAISGFAQNTTEWTKLEKPINFILANDLGRNGYYDQKPIAGILFWETTNIVAIHRRLSTIAM